MANFKIVVPSMGREVSFWASLAPQLPCPVYVVVFDSETEDYEKNRTSDNVEVIGIPQSLVGVAAKKNWILANLWHSDEEFLVLMDDDVSAFTWSMIFTFEKLTPHEILQRFEEEYFLALAFGAPIFGIRCEKNPLYVNRFQPINLHSCLQGGLTGILDRNLFFDPNVIIGDDVDITCMSLFRKGLIFYDQMVTFQCHYPVRSGAKGGMTVHRNTQRIRESRDYLRHKYGPFVDKISRRVI